MTAKKHVRLHILYLQSILKTGARVTKVNHVAVFKHSNWMKDFVLSNTLKRNMSQNIFDKNYYKLIVNSNFGKMAESVKLYSNVELVR